MLLIRYVLNLANNMNCYEVFVSENISINCKYYEIVCFHFLNTIKSDHEGELSLSESTASSLGLKFNLLW